MKYYRLLRFFQLVLILLAGFMSPLAAQNLIPDPGFELWDGTVGNPPETLSPLTFWYEANGTPDHHHQDNPAGSNLTSLLPCPTGNGNTECGIPHSGKAVLGCWKGNGPDGSKEWAGTQLLEPMVPGACYKVSYWFQNKEDNPNFLMLTNQWGVFFSKTMIPTFNPNLINFATRADQFVTCSEVNDGSDWSYVEFLYTPTDAYTYAYVGYMGNVSTSTFTAWSNDFQIGFYAWFDDVAVERIVPELTTTGDQTICLGDSVFLSATSNYPVEWNTGTSLDTVDGLWVKPTATTTYSVRTLDGTSCSLTEDITVTVLGATINPFTEAVCAGTNPFVINPLAGAGTWSGPGIINPATGLFDAGQAGPGIHLLQFAPEGDCALGYQVEIEVIPAPIVDFSVDQPVGCPPHALQFFDESVPKVASVLWTFGDGTIGNTFNDPLKTYFESGWYSVTLEAYYSDYCTAALTKDSFIHILVPPTADFSFTPDDPSNLQPEVQFTDRSTGDPQSWSWNFGDGNFGTGADPAHTFAQPGVYAITLAVGGAEGCGDTLTRELIVQWDIRLYLPTAFSPNRDGINDIFQPSVIGPIDTYRLQVFDRWGGLLFESTDPQVGWNGEGRGGRILEPGVYTWIVEARPASFGGPLPEVKRYFGELQLMR
ncbi:MAG: gliding motility-associated C-terminal domain-containing protein [Lewinellaceae bacterium]|nr:gliding motility-associated C-terminal domain-containing protein [Saprospiraceae bacterium]MCB9314372.1 gliding motility-associated C-terminal domain-containing protein [Lewinellaceae bacterium]